MLNRALYSASGALTDLTPQLLDYYGNDFDLTYTAATDSIFIGSKYPFTRKYFKVSADVPNVLPANIQIQYWDGTAWRDSVEIIDETVLVDVPLDHDGYVSFTPDKQYQWKRDDTVSNGTERITGLGTLTIYDLYWVKITYSADIATTLTWSGDIFCTESDLYSEYPDMSRSAVLTAFLSGKTTWEEQRVVASELVAADLKQAGVTPSSNLVLSADQLRRATVSKTAALAFGALEGFQDTAKKADLEYAKRMSPRYFDIDTNEDGQDDPEERQVKISRMTR